MQPGKDSLLLGYGPCLQKSFPDQPARISSTGVLVVEINGVLIAGGARTDVSTSDKAREGGSQRRRTNDSHIPPWDALLGPLPKDPRPLCPSNRLCST